MYARMKPTSDRACSDDGDAPRVPVGGSATRDGEFGYGDTTLTPLEFELAQLLVTTLRLEDPPNTISPHEPLFVDGLGLDSIDALEIALAISTIYGFDIRSDDTDDWQIFANLRALAAHVQQYRAR